MKFHTIHGTAVTLTEDRTVSDSRTGAGQPTVFSAEPLQIGESVKLEVLDPAGRIDPSLRIGVTTMDPKHWDLSVRPWNHQDTWSLVTRTGGIYIKGKYAGECEEWGRKGCDRVLQTGDRIGLRITGDQTMSISVNDTEVPDVFSCQLPDTDLWVVINQLVKKIKIIPGDKMIPDIDGALPGLNQMSLSDHSQALPVHETPVKIPLSSTLQSGAGPSCDYWQICLKFVLSLGIAGEYFDQQHNMCYCQSCMDSRNDNLYYTRGVPPKKYALPVGWARFGLSTSPRARKLDIFRLWHVAFHGTSAANVESILDTGDLLLPGDSTLDGKELQPPPGHFTEKRKPTGFDIKQVFVSPSIRYAGLPAYAHFVSWQDNATKKMYKARVVLQLGIKPDSYKVGPETVLPPHFKRVLSIDDGMDNSELEWSTKNRGATIPTGLMVHLMPE